MMDRMVLPVFRKAQESATKKINLPRGTTDYGSIQSLCERLLGIYASGQRSGIRLALALLLTVAWACPSFSGEMLLLECSPADRGTARVSDPAASGGEAVAIDVTEEKDGIVRLQIPDTKLKAGLYRIFLRLRLYLPPDYDHTRLFPTVLLYTGEKQFVSLPLNWTIFDWTPGHYTVFMAEAGIFQTGRLSCSCKWRVDELPAHMTQKAAQVLRPPSMPQSGAELDDRDTEDDELGELLLADSAVPLSALAYPAVLIDSIELEMLTNSLAVASVRPDKVHVYPGGEENPVTVTVRNYSKQSAGATVRLVMRTGLAGEEKVPVGAAPITVPAFGTAKHAFSWKSGSREFGHEAVVSVICEGKVVHTASEVFSVSTPVWKTAIQGNGFIDWYGREKQLPEHVRRNRKQYINVEEAFSWQPSSWTDLNPSGDDWWTGQNNYHNSMAGLRLWLDLSHKQGIKMITYLWSAASGPAGLEWGRKYPELLTHCKIGLGSAFHDVEDLRLYGITHKQESLWDYQYNIWHSIGINRGRLEAIAMGVDEVIRSARKFGWDGMRFDSMPIWSAMGSDTVWGEFKRMGVTDLMKSLVPEYMEKRTGNWDATAISVRNIRYAKRRLWSELGRNFAIASNFSQIPEKGEKFVGEIGYEYVQAYCQDGAQVNHEYPRQSKKWSEFLDTVQTQAERTRINGGFHMVQGMNDLFRGAAAHQTIFTYASGAHPYVFGFSLEVASPGAYNRFITRYGEYVWDPALEPVGPETAGLEIDAPENVMWKRFLRQRKLKGSVELVVQLVSKPVCDMVAPPEAHPMPAWVRNITLRRKGSKDAVAYCLSAEPEPRCDRLAVKTVDGLRTVTIPEHRLWSVIVWREAGPE